MTAAKRWVTGVRTDTPEDASSTFEVRNQTLVTRPEDLSGDVDSWVEAWQMANQMNIMVWDTPKWQLEISVMDSLYHLHKCTYDELVDHIFGVKASAIIPRKFSNALWNLVANKVVMHTLETPMQFALVYEYNFSVIDLSQDS